MHKPESISTDNQPQLSMNVLVVTGPTASGKTRFAALLAQQLDGEIISADSRQVYRGMDLGTGKDYQDYEVEGRRIPSHLIDMLEPGAAYDVYQFQQDFYRLFRHLHGKGKLPVLCGGTGMYVEAAVEQYAMQEVPRDMALRRRLQHKSMDELRKLYFDWEPNPHNTTDTENRERLLRAIEIAMHQKWTKAGEAPEIRPLIFVLYFERELQKRRIRKRLLQRLEEGMVEEVQSLMQQGISLDTLEYYGLEYRYIGRYLTGRLSYNQMVEELNVAIRQFAKKQMTWFRRMEKKGHRLHWINGQMPEEEKLQHALQVIRNAKNSQT